MREIFEIADTDKSGQLDQAEIHATASSLTLSSLVRHCQRLICENWQEELHALFRAWFARFSCLAQHAVARVTLRRVSIPRILYWLFFVLSPLPFALEVITKSEIA